ncbi:MAG TPA: hypothetical protein VNU01_06995 [Egibacteraceae bacterium]|nr:hypothetical protein [Egibacteraceae bacterium]
MTASVIDWTAALDEWESFLDELEGALDSGEWEAHAERPPWAPPGDVIGELGPEGEARALALADRAGRLRERLDRALRATAAEIGEGRRKGAAVSAYARQQRRR